MPVARCVVDGAVVVDACGEEVGGGLLGMGGVEGEHCGGGGLIGGRKRYVCVREYIGSEVFISWGRERHRVMLCGLMVSRQVVNGVGCLREIFLDAERVDCYEAQLGGGTCDKIEQRFFGSCCKRFKAR